MNPRDIISGQQFQLARIVTEEDSALALHGPDLVMVFRGRWNNRGEGEALLQLGHAAHCGNAEAGTEILWLRMTAQLAGRFRGLYDDAVRPLTFDDLRGIPETLHYEMQSRDAATPAIVEGLILQMLALGSRASSSARRAAPSWFPRAIQFIHSNLASGLTVDEVSRAAGISSSRLAHSFRALTGRTFGAYLNEARVQAAAIALRTTESSVADIAASVGFYDQSHFCRTFKALKRFTPMEYRRLRKAA